LKKTEGHHLCWQRLCFTTCDCEVIKHATRTNLWQSTCARLSRGGYIRQLVCPACLESLWNRVGLGREIWPK